MLHFCITKQHTFHISWMFCGASMTSKGLCKFEGAVSNTTVYTILKIILTIAPGHPIETQSKPVSC